MGLGHHDHRSEMACFGWVGWGLVNERGGSPWREFNMHYKETRMKVFIRVLLTMKARDDCFREWNWWNVRLTMVLPNFGGTMMYIQPHQRFACSTWGTEASLSTHSLLQRRGGRDLGCRWT